jgi:nitroimidazol reductase NimA-like FMN-containing flavoprotein (pyridoxamine 5'-phosphate oxidase superfamily)
MFRKDREIKDKQEVMDVLLKCNTLRVGMNAGEYPYVVPVSFGAEEKDGKAVIYFHGAIKGMKIDCLKKDNNVCVEGDIFYKTEPTKTGITARFESIIGFGTAEEANEEEKLHGLRLILDHYGYPEYPVDRCKTLKGTVVYKITLDELTGKRNLPENV